MGLTWQTWRISRPVVWKDSETQMLFRAVTALMCAATCAARARRPSPSMPRRRPFGWHIGTRWCADACPWHRGAPPCVHLEEVHRVRPAAGLDRVDLVAARASLYDSTFSRTVWRMYDGAKGLVMWT